MQNEKVEGNVTPKKKAQFCGKDHSINFADGS